MKKVKIKKKFGYIGLIIVLGIVLISSMIYFYYSQRGSSVTEIVEVAKDGLVDKPRDYRSVKKDRLFIVPQATASAIIRNTYVELVDSYAVEGNSLSIKECKPDVEVLSIKEGDNLTLRNSDNVNRTIFISTSKTVLSPNESKEIGTDFGNGNGIYLLYCDSTKNPVGIIRTK